MPQGWFVANCLCKFQHAPIFFIPYLHCPPYQAAEICAIFSKVNISTEEVGACIDLDIELLGATILDANLGCFTLHIPDANTTTTLLAP